MQNLLYFGANEELVEDFTPSYDPFLNFVHVLRLAMLYITMESLEKNQKDDEAVFKVDPDCFNKFSRGTDSLLALNKLAEHLTLKTRLN